MKLWNYRKADRQFRNLLYPSVLTILEIIGLIVVYSSEVPVEALLLLVGIIILTFVLLLIGLSRYTDSAELEERVNWEIRQRHLSQDNSQTATVSYKTNGSLLAIVHNNRCFFGDGQSGIYSIVTTKLSPNIQLYGVNFSNQEENKNIFFLVELLTNSMVVVTVYKPKGAK